MSGVDVMFQIENRLLLRGLLMDAVEQLHSFRKMVLTMPLMEI